MSVQFIGLSSSILFLALRPITISKNLGNNPPPGPFITILFAEYTGFIYKSLSVDGTHNAWSDFCNAKN